MKTHQAASPREARRPPAAHEGRRVVPQSRPPARAVASQPRRQFVPLLISLTVLLVVWQVAVLVFAPPPWLVPAPTAIARRFVEVLGDGTLARHTWRTLIESMGGFALALATGVPLGYLVAHNRTVERWIAPYLAAIQSVPVIALAPLLVVWWQGGDISRNIVVAALVVFFPMFSATVTGIRTIPRELREVAKVEGASRSQLIRFLELPVALPVLLSGIRTSLAYATTGAVVGEFIGARYGLGVLINVARGASDMALVAVALLCLVAITLVFYGMLTVLERIILNWCE